MNETLEQTWRMFSRSVDLTRQWAWDVRHKGDFGEAFAIFERKLSDATKEYHDAVLSRKC